MKKIVIICCILMLVLSGCATTDKQPDLTQIKTDLDVLTGKPRAIGSEGEAEAVGYIAERFENMGYTVTSQEYKSEDGAVGNNVIAVRNSDKTGDILVISAHHDSVPTSFGANDNASGVVALLAVAERMADVDTDTELRFISFTDEENGKNGSRQYVENLQEEERQRIVGCIQFDMLGGLGTDGTVVCTTDGSSNWLSSLLIEKDNTLVLGTETASDHAIFQLAGIPSVLVMQEERGYLYHTIADTADQLDLQTIYNAASVVGDVVKNIASDKTPSYQDPANRKYIYHHERQSKIFYSASREDNEAYLGFSGELVNRWEDKGEFWHDIYEVYQYDMGWFGGETLMTTHYIYRNGYLENVEIHPAENGYTTEQLCTLITNTHGTPSSVDKENNYWAWEDELYGKYISLQEEEGKPVVSVSSCSLGISNTLATYDVKNGEAVIEDPQHAKVWELLCKALPVEHRQKIDQFQLFTDGFGNILAYTSPMGSVEDIDNSGFCITVDYYDVYDENSNARDWSTLLYTLIHEYGHVLLEDDTQIDLSKGNDTHDPATFIEGSFRQRYFEEFWKDPYESFLGSYWDAPENYVSQYAANLFHEDIADTFAVFVFGGKPEGDSVAEKKLLFFWNDSDMVALREDIREGLDLD